VEVGIALTVALERCTRAVVERAGDGGDGDPVDDGDVAGREVERGVHPDAFALAPASALHGHVDPATRRRAEFVQRRSVHVAQHRARPDRPHCCEPPARIREPPVPERVHPAVKGDQPLGVQSATNLRARRAHGSESVDIHDPMIALCQR
jgi:hypothetical protein